MIDAGYYSISVDSSTDISHTDQLAFCIRYVKNGSAVERFLQFIPIHGHTAEYLTETVISFLKDKEIDIKKCRGQSYDNANNMSGIYGGLQTQIRAKNDLAIFVPCGAHSLNLVGKNSVSKIPTAVQFFSIVESTYEYFVNSTFRWQELNANLTEKNELKLKRATGTRWSAKRDAILALHSCFEKVLNVLKSLASENSTQCDESKANAILMNFIRTERSKNYLIHYFYQFQTQFFRI